MGFFLVDCFVLLGDFFAAAVVFSMKFLPDGDSVCQNSSICLISYYLQSLAIV